MQNMPKVRLGIAGVSRDCFPIELTKKRLAELVKAAKKSGVDLIPSSTIIENEANATAALKELSDAGANACVVYLGNFGPEGPTTIFIRDFNGPAMVCAAAEETGKNLIDGRGDAYCGLLNCSYNLALRNLRAHIPEKPVGVPEQLIPEIKRFEKIAAAAIAVKKLKVIAFGPRPPDFYACNAPIKPLYNLGIEVMENSELDLFERFNAEPESKETDAIASDMKKELGGKPPYPDLLKKLARFENALVKFIESAKGRSDYVVLANKCWPAFQTSFGFVPCYVNSRLASRGIPVACEVDMYGAVSEYMAQIASGLPATILDINNTTPADMMSKKKSGPENSDLFMGFHCGNTPSCHLCNPAMKFQLIMRRLLEPASEPNISRGTLEGQLKPGPVTLFRLQGSADGRLLSYVAEGKVEDIDPRSFGAIGVINVKDMGRFYRHALVGGNFPHHAAIAFDSVGGILFDTVKLIAGIAPAYPLPAGTLYPGENPF